MKIKNFLFVLLSFLLVFTSCDQLTDGLSDEEIVAGLKEALQVGADTSVTTVNKTDGYYGNSLLRIPFPDDVKYVETAVSNLTILGQPVGQVAVDAFVLKLNRAAENAAYQAKPIFLNAISGMTITDGLNILMGADNAATSYLETNTFDALKTAFQPDIQNSLDAVGAQAAWNEVATLYNTVSNTPANTDLADHTTRKALNGLFTLIASEELKIRTDVGYRVSDLLKKVFAEQD